MVRQKNVLSVGHPSTGVYCIQPSTLSGIQNVYAITPSATMEYGASYTATGLVEYVNGQYSCPYKTIEFRTFTLDLYNGYYYQSDDIAFVVVVP